MESGGGEASDEVRRFGAVRGSIGQRDREEVPILEGTMSQRLGSIREFGAKLVRPNIRDGCRVSSSCRRAAPSQVYPVGLPAGMVVTMWV